MGRKKRRRKDPAISASGSNRVADRYEAASLYQRMFEEGDMVWLVDEYRRRRSSEPSLTLEDFADQYGVSVDELRSYFPESSDGFEHSVTLWHGTSESRAQSILEEGFRPKRAKAGRTLFTSRVGVARWYAQRRANIDRDQPVVIMCCIDLDKYWDFEWLGSVYAFKAECISSEVIREVIKLTREPRGKPKKQKDHSAELTNIALTFSSGRGGIAYWINSYLELSDPCKVDEDHEAVGKIKEWLDDQTEAGRFGEVPHDEMLEQLGKHVQCLYQ
jgi:hypothetical protein